MLRVQSNTDMKGFTEYEEDIHFDEDDPDFDGFAVPSIPFILKAVATKMSLASVYPASEVHSSHSSLSTLSQSLDDIQSWSATASVTTTATTTTTNTHYPQQQQQQQQQQQEPVLTIEQLRAQLSSCFTCGVCWADQHVSLDCSECGGYALQRPCADCEGQCGELWRRDFTLSHESSKAKWQGVCKRANPAPAPVNEPAAQEQLCSRLEKLTAKTSAT